ncbi:major facilitator superfamily domain-containing protein [Phycomyces nitens]|nr:major facilitator superfamily domain-containing protein [Phycomyces nitens]
MSLSKYPLETLPSNRNRDSFTSLNESDSSLIYNNKHERPISVEERALVRKIDWCVLPLICLVNFLQFLDKSAINYANALGLQADTGLVGDQYSTVVSLFYLGYLCYQIPNNYLLQHIQIGRYIGILLVVWGTILASTASADNFAHLAALRFLLGFAEGGIYPCLILLVSTLYRRSEQTSRLGAFWLCNGVALCAGGFISYGIGKIPYILGLHPWRWCMIILGSVTVLVGFICFFFLIDDPRSLKWRHNAEEQILVEERIRDNAVVRTTKVNYAQIKEALTESRLWCFCLISFLLNIQNGALTNFSTTITQGFGFTNLDAILLQTPTGLVDVFYIVTAAYVSQRTGQSIYVACCCIFCTAVGLVVLEFTPVDKYKLIGFYICWGYAAAYVMLLSSTTMNVSGFTKKIFYNGMIMIFYTAGNFTGPYTLVASQAPNYIGGMMGYVGGDILAIILFLFVRWRMVKINKRRLSEPVSESTNVDEDMTDKQDENFIYRL